MTSRITSTPDVCGGEPCIANTRIPVWMLYRAMRLGMTDTKIMDAFPHLTDDDLAAAWDYVAKHTAEIEQQMAANESA